MTCREDLPRLSRREFVRAGAGVAILLPHGRAWSASGPDRAVEHGNPLGEFHYAQVQLQPGPHQSQLEQAIGIVMELDDDGMLRPYRLRGGFSAPGFELGGWLVLFAISDDTPKVTRAQLLAARQQSAGSTDWRVEAAGGPLRLRPFWIIKDETYFTYLSV